MRDKKENRGYFPNHRRFYFEYRCPNTLEQGPLCSRCLSWKNKEANKKDPYRIHYGLVTEPLGEDTPFFGSSWFESKLKEYGQPNEDDMAKAKKAQETARKDVVVETKPVVVETKPTKRRGKATRKPKEAPAPSPLPPPPPQPPIPVPDPEPEPDPNPPPKPSEKRRTKPVGSKPTVQVQAIETSPQLTDLEIVKIVVRPFQVNDTSYFRDVCKNKLYSVGKDKRPSVYVGRWNPETESIDTEFPDSDAE